ncbi:MAG: hypothetical protein WD577_05220 [Bacteroidales bacterium]
MKRLLLILVPVLFFTTTVVAQPERIGAGLTFSTEKRFNEGATGNPGVNIKTWIPLSKKRVFHLTPSVTLFNPQVVNQIKYLTTTYMFHGDLDLQYLVFHEKTMKLVALGGINYTHIISRIEEVITFPEIPADSSVTGLGPSMGAAMEMRMSPHWDFIVSGRYNFAGLRLGDATAGEKFMTAPLSAPILQVHAVYYFTSRGRGYSRR